MPIRIVVNPVPLISSHAITEPIVQARSNVEDGVKLGCGMFIVLPLLILAGAIFLVIFLFLLGIFIK